MRDRIASGSLAAGIAVLLAIVGASLYEHLVVDVAWPDNPGLIQPERGGIDRKAIWIPLHGALTGALAIALWAAWPRRPVRRLVIGAALIYVAMRAWTIAYFIPEALRFEQAFATSEGAARWIALSLLRFPMVVGSLVLLVIASRRLRIALAAATVAACNPYNVCDTPDPAVLESAPARLSETGLGGDGVVPYTPRFELWSDGAEKQRWIRLPAGASIDTSDPDEWRFPVGTRLWKQFSRDDVPIETRMLEKVGEPDGAWLMVAYVHGDDGDATIAPDGVADARGTAHDVPSATDCRGCHDGRRSRVLGYSAIQLGDDPIPGSEVERAALGYLHANCSHCHNAARPARGRARCYAPENGLDFRLLTARLATVGDTPTYATALDELDRIRELAGHRGPPLQMPPLGTEQVDERGVAVLQRWIEEVSP